MFFFCLQENERAANAVLAQYNVAVVQELHHEDPEALLVSRCIYYVNIILFPTYHFNHNRRLKYLRQTVLQLTAVRHHRFL
jgi:hypothetical protein